MSEYLETVEWWWRDAQSVRFRVDCSRLVVFQMQEGKFVHYYTNPTPLRLLHNQTAERLIECAIDLGGFTGVVALDKTAMYRCYTGTLREILSSLMKVYPQHIQIISPLPDLSKVL